MSVAERVLKYVDQLKDPEKIRHALGKLNRIDMSVELLRETSVGKAVNRLRKHAEYGEKARLLVDKWRRLANAQSAPDAEDATAATGGESDDRDSDAAAARKRVADDGGEEITAACKVSFEDALNAPPPPPKKIKIRVSVPPQRPPPSHESVVLPTLTRVLGPAAAAAEALSISPMPAANSGSSVSPLPPKQQAEESYPEAGTFRKGRSSKMYTGRKHVRRITAVERLEDLSMAVCLQNVERLSHCYLPTVFYVFRPVLERCSVEQLARMENNNPQFQPDTDVLWKKHCLAKFPKAVLEDGETWRQCYKRYERENEERLRSLSSRIRTQTRGDTQLTTKLITHVPPRHAQRRPGGGGGFPSGGFGGNRSGSGFAPRSQSSASRSSSAAAAASQTRGVLMQKAIKMMKARSRR